MFFLIFMIAECLKQNHNIQSICNRYSNSVYIKGKKTPKHILKQTNVSPHLERWKKKTTQRML